MNDSPIVVVGAGLAGLTAANFLHQHGKKVLVFEASPNIAGLRGARKMSRVSPTIAVLTLSPIVWRRRSDARRCAGTWSATVRRYGIEIVDTRIRSAC